MTSPKRKYVRLSPSKWAELRAYWESGDYGLAELSDKYGVSQRAIQTHLKKLGSAKGLKAAEMAVVVRKEVFEEVLGHPDALVSRAKETREAAYTNAATVESLVMAQLELAQKDPTQAFKAATALKMLSLAAGVLERVQGVKLRALGLDKESALSDEMPMLIMRDLSKEEIEGLRERDEADEDGEFGISLAPACIDSDFTSREVDKSDDVIEEGAEMHGEEIIAEDDEPKKPSEPRAKSVDTLGGRLVKEALP
jgi:hypothetical protein